MTKLGMADIHIHTDVSDGMMSVAELLEYVEEKTFLDVIAVTDHDEISGSLAARELAVRKRYRFEVITGMEISTLEGHLLALFVDNPIPSYRHIDETIDAVHAQGGLCIATHPMSWLTRSIGESTLDRIVCGADGCRLDGLETANGQMAAKVTAKKTTRLNKERYHLPETGGSDAHFLASVGTAFTTFPGDTAEDLRRSLLANTCRSQMGTPVSLGSIGPWQVARQLTRGLLVLPVRNLRKSFARRAKKASTTA